MIERDGDWPRMRWWWWVMFIGGSVFWAAVIFVAVHFIAKWW